METIMEAWRFDSVHGAKPLRQDRAHDRMTPFNPVVEGKK
jgi:hypothetical protein